MKKKALLATILPMLLSGCMTNVFQYDRGNPVVMAALQDGATKQSVLSRGGPPAGMLSLPQINGVCFNYVLRKNANSSPFYVAFNEQDRVVNAGYITCANARNSGYLESRQPLGQKR